MSPNYAEENEMKQDRKDCTVSAPLREAERLIGISMARLGKIGPGGSKAWIGSWGEYKKLGGLMMKTRALADVIEGKERSPLRPCNRSKPRELRISWALYSGHSGHGQWYPESYAEILMRERDDLILVYGTGTHWIEVREV